MSDAESPRPSFEQLQQRIHAIELKQEQGVERLAAMRAAGFRMDAELRELRATLARLTEVRPQDARLLMPDVRGGQEQSWQGAAWGQVDVQLSMQCMMEVSDSGAFIRSLRWPPSVGCSEAGSGRDPTCSHSNGAYAEMDADRISMKPTASSLSKQPPPPQTKLDMATRVGSRLVSGREAQMPEGCTSVDAHLNR